MKAPHKLLKKGDLGSREFRVRAVTPCADDEADNVCSTKHVSLWHDIMLYANKEKNIVNYVCEIPKGTRDKFEIDTKDRGNPIRQDLDKQGNLCDFI